MKTFKSKSIIAAILVAMTFSFTGNLDPGISENAYAQELEEKEPFLYVGYNPITEEETTYVWDEVEQIGRAIDVKNVACDTQEKPNKQDDTNELGYESETNAINSSTPELISNPENSEQYASTVFISVEGADGITGRGTGFLIAPNVVLTAGHMVYDDGTITDGVGWGGNGWIKKYSSITLANGTWSNTPAATTRGIQYYCGYNWAKYCDQSNDWGLIILEDNVTCNLEHFKLSPIDGAVGQTSVSLNGYPASLSTDTPTHSEEIWEMYEWKGRICSEADESKPLRSNNIMSYTGASGGPCYKTSGLFTKKYSVIGIYSHKDRSNTFFTKIDSPLYNIVSQYMA